MTDSDREAMILELLMRTGVYYEKVGKQPANMMESTIRIVSNCAFLRLDARSERIEEACKNALKIAGICENFLRTFATDEILYNLIVDSDLPEAVSDGV